MPLSMLRVCTSGMELGRCRPRGHGLGRAALVGLGKRSRALLPPLHRLWANQLSWRDDRHGLAVGGHPQTPAAADFGAAEAGLLRLGI